MYIRSLDDVFVKYISWDIQEYENNRNSRMESLLKLHSFEKGIAQRLIREFICGICSFFMIPASEMDF